MSYDLRRALQLATVALILHASSAWATTRFEEQLACLRQAVRNLRLPDSPYVVPVSIYEGPSDFLLPAKDMPWTSSYFPMNQGGIAVRWQRFVGPPTPGDFMEPGELFAASGRKTVIRRLKELPQEDIDKMSAIEKFDILNGHYDFAATRTELFKRGPLRNPPPEWWEGFCNGLCAASVALPEPTQPVTLVNSEGIKVTFQPNDIKALANASYYFVERYAQIGSPNRTKLAINFATLPDPGVLDWALTHYLAGLHKPFVADKTPSSEVWNHTVVGYRDRFIFEPVRAEPGDPKGVEWKAIVQLKILYSGSNITHEQGNTPLAPLMAEGNHIEARNLRYELYLDRSKKVIGGRWPEGPDYPTTDAPAFLWFPAGRGADATQGLNPYLEADQIENLVRRSAGSQ